MYNINTKPLVSIIMPSYNHEKFIGKAIESILKQTYINWELIITDDGSTDESAYIIKQYNDKRIHKYFFPKNQGAAIAVRNCLQKVSGKYIALLNSDDEWSEDKLSIQVEFLEKHSEYAAVFSNAEFINEKDIVISDSYKYYDIFKTENRSRGEWLEYFFFHGNCICHPSILIQREFYDSGKLHNEALRQLPDFNLWIELIKKASFFILQDKLVRFRVLDNGKNTSADTPKNKVRNINELYIIYHNFFDNIPDDIFIEGFKKYFKSQFALQDKNLLKFEKIFLYFVPHGEISILCKLIGMKKLYDCFSNERDVSLLKKYYSFDFKSFHLITGDIDSLYILNDKFKISPRTTVMLKRRVKAMLPVKVKKFLKVILPNDLVNRLK